MQEKNRESNMIDFIVTKLSLEDQKTADMIRPLPSSIVPSAQFTSETRLQVLALGIATEGERNAA